MKNKPYILLVGVDYSELSDRALQEAFAQASQRNDAEVHVLTALPAIATEDPGYAVAAHAPLDEKAVLGAAVQRLRTHVELEIEKFALTNSASKVTFRVISHALVDDAAHALVQLASHLDADLILLGTHNRKGLERLLLGSVAEGTVRHATCPVLVIPAAKEAEPEVTIEPPCPECVEGRVRTQGREFWCERHRERHGRRHTYHQIDRSSSDSNFPLVYR